MGSQFLGVQCRSRTTAEMELCESVYPAGALLSRHQHPTAFFCLTVEGGYIEKHSSASIEFNPSSVAFHPQGEEHAVRIGHKDVRCLNISLSETWLARLAAACTVMPAFVQSEGGELTWLATRLLREMQAWNDASPLTAEGIVLEMLGTTALSLLQCERQGPAWLREADEILHEEFRDTLSITSLAARVGVHPVHLSRVWRRWRGGSIAEYVMRLRIAEACRRLAGPDGSDLAGLALHCGFADQSHFSRTFKRMTGQTPARYARLFGARARRSVSIRVPES